jgi:hypothetical protein
MVKLRAARRGSEGLARSLLRRIRDRFSARWNRQVNSEV